MRAPRKAVVHEDMMAARPLERVVTDLVGAMKHRSIRRFKHFVTLLNESSGYSIVRFFRRKSEAAEVVVGMIQELETLFNSKVHDMTLIYRRVVKWVRSDGGGEYIGTEF